MFSRTENLIGKDSLKKLQASTIAIFGLGGVGGYVVEALARSGVEKFVLVDNDVVSKSNLNRQIIALHSTLGKLKTETFKARLLDINPNVEVVTYNQFILPDTIDTIDLSKVNYVVDAIDTVSGKIAIIEKAKQKNIPVISCMGTGNKLKADYFKIADISKTDVCPLARVMRRELKNRGIEKVKVLYSQEQPKKNTAEEKPVPSSIAYVPSVAGLLIAGEVIQDLIK